MGIWGGLMGPKIEDVGFSLVLPLLFEGSRWPRWFQENEQAAEKCVFEVQIKRYLIKQISLAICRIVSTTQAGSTLSEKSEKKVIEKWKKMPKELRWQVWWVYEGAWWGLKSKMLVFHWFYHYCLKGQGLPEYPNRAESWPRSTVWEGKGGG